MLEPRAPASHDAHHPDLPPLPTLNLDEHTPSKNYWWVWLLVFALIGYGCYKLYQFETSKTAAASAKKAMMMKPRSIPVAAATAYRQYARVFAGFGIRHGVQHSDGEAAH